MSQQQFRILTVCTMNICRSPALESLLAPRLAVLPMPTAVESAGTQARAGAPRCPHSLTGTGYPPATGSSRELAQSDLEHADLILTASRDHSATILRLSPRARDKVFPIRTAARIATWIAEAGTLAAGVARANNQLVEKELINVPALPETPLARAAWLIAEMSEARGLAPRRLSADDDGEIDVPDPHIIDESLHASNAALLVEAVRALARAFATVVDI